MRYYVASNGTGNASSWGSMGDLIATVNHVLNNPSRGGDEIWALQGTYNLAGNPLVINNNTEPLSIYGGFAGWENTLCDRNANIDSLQYPTFFQNPSILDGGGMNRVIEMQQANVCLIDGFVIRNGAATGAPGGSVYAVGSNIWFEKLVIMDNITDNDGGGMFTQVFNLMVKNAIFFNNTAANNGGGLYVGDAKNVILVNLLFNGNLTAGGNGDAIYVGGNDGLKIINNTITGNTGGSSSVYCYYASNVSIYNSILYPDTLAAAGSANLAVDYCLLSNPIPFANPANPNGINPLPPPAPPVDPLFVNPAARNYHLRPISQCIDSGNTEYTFPFSITDLEGKPRFISNTGVALEVDMGAFEVQ